MTKFAAPIFEPPLHHRVSRGTTIALHVATVLAIVLPFAGVIAAGILFWGHGFSLTPLLLLVGFYMASGLGITIGYHRLFTHRSFQTYKPIQILLALLGSMAIQGPLFRWTATHRRHHQHSDEHNDPHSPHHHGDGWRGLFLGMVYAHIGWLFDNDPEELGKYVGDLKKDRALVWMDRLFPVWAILGLILPAIIGGWAAQSWMGALLGFVWGGLVRVFLVHHVTWSINSVCHTWGARPFETGDESRNNPLFGILGMGEGWHNNHHAFPTSARHGLFWWQFDLSYVIIRTLEMLGLVWKIRIPDAETMTARQLASRGKTITESSLLTMDSDPG